MKSHVAFLSWLYREEKNEFNDNSILNLTNSNRLCVHKIAELHSILGTAYEYKIILDMMDTFITLGLGRCQDLLTKENI